MLALVRLPLHHNDRVLQLLINLRSIHLRMPSDNTRAAPMMIVKKSDAHFVISNAWEFVQFIIKIYITLESWMKKRERNPPEIVPNKEKENGLIESFVLDVYWRMERRRELTMDVHQRWAHPERITQSVWRMEEKRRIDRYNFHIPLKQQQQSGAEAKHKKSDDFQLCLPRKSYNSVQCRCECDEKNGN